MFFSHEIATICEHYSYTLIELFAGYAVGASIGLVLAAVITQFPFVEKVITPYILLLVTTPMLALVPLLILNFGFGFTPRIIAVALASGPMVMINAATGFRRVDAMKIALAAETGYDLLQADPESGSVRVIEAPAEAMVIHTFWFAWAAFYPETEMFAER